MGQPTPVSTGMTKKERLPVIASEAKQSGGGVVPSEPSEESSTTTNKARLPVYPFDSPKCVSVRCFPLVEESEPKLN